MTLDEDLQHVRTEIIHSIFTGLSILAPIALVGSLARMFSIGFKPAMAVQLVAVLLLCTVSIFRHKLTLAFKSACLLVLLFIPAIGGILQFGLLSTMIITMAVAPSFALMLYGRRIAILAFATAIVSFCLIGIYIVTRGILPSVAPAAYLVSPLAWLNAALTMLLVTGLLVFAHDRYSRTLLQALTMMQQQEQLKRELENQKRFGEMFYNHSAVMLLVDPVRGTIANANHAAEKFYGYSRGQLLAMAIQDLNTLDPDLVQHERKKAVAGDKNVFVFTHRLANGENHPVEVHSTPITVNDQTVLFSIIHDITDRKRAEDDLRRSRDEWKRTFDAMPDMIFIIDDKQHILRINKAASDILGIAEDQALAVPCYEYMHGTDKPPESCPHLSSLKDHDNHQVDALVERLGQHYQVTTTPIFDSQGNYEATVHVAHDISQRIQHEQELEEARQAADAANRAKSDFLSSMSHEIRTPMNGVIGMTQLLQMTALTDEQKEYVEALEISGNHLLSLINDILDLSKIEAGKVEVEYHDFSLQRSIADVVLTQKSAIHKKGLSLTVDVSGEIPDVVTGDQLRVKQVLSNLLSNAVKFTLTGGIRITAGILERHGSTLLTEIAVHDTGIGMSEKTLASIFKPFVQAETSTTRQFGGTGLGLAICRNLAELMGGTVSVESEHGNGSSFRFILPFRVHEKIQTPEAEDTILPSWDGPRLKVLFVEDNPINMAVNKAFCTKLGFSGVFVENGRECLAALQQQSFDLVLMDIQMPVMAGGDTLQEIRSLELGTTRHQPVIAVTAYALRHDSERFLQEGFDGYVSKPVRLDALIREIKRVLPV
jgi:PAS domain S-box-containing protein